MHCVERLVHCDACCIAAEFETAFAIEFFSARSAELGDRMGSKCVLEFQSLHAQNNSVSEEEEEARMRV